MAVIPSVQEFLRTSNVAYTVFPHRAAFTAAEEAAVTHTPGFRWAKTIACFADGRPILAVVPAHYLVDQERLADVADAGIVRLAREDELEWLFPDCEPGAMPPFGNLYGMQVFVDEALSHEGLIAFNAGSHREEVEMAYADYEWLAHPTVAEISHPLLATAT
jgi:Ala-tRNA(Pro) deacylase